MATPTRALIELATAYAVLVDTEDISEYQTALDGLTAEIGKHAEGIALAIRSLEAGSEAISREIDRLEMLREWRDRRAKELRIALLTALQRAGMRRVEGQLVRVLVGLNPPAVRVLDGVTLPPEYERVIPARIEPDKRALLEAYRAGKALPSGVEIVQSVHLKVM